MELVTPGIGLIFWMTLVFLTLLFILGKFAWKPILKALKDREQSIDNALRSAEEAQAKMEQLNADNEKLLAEARIERDKILKEAKEMKDQIVAAAKEEAADKGRKMIEEAKQEIGKEKNKAINELKSQVSTLSIEIAEKILRKEVAGDKEQEALIDDYMNTINLN